MESRILKMKAELE